MMKLDSVTPFLLAAMLCAVMSAQSVPAVQSVPAKKEDSKPDFSREGVVIERTLARVDFNSDGTATRRQETRVRVQSEAGVQQYGVLSFPYQSAVEHLDIQYVRVQKPDGTIITTPPDFVQDMPTEVSRTAPFYSDLREKQVAVKRLAPGDILEYAAAWQQDKPLAPGNFWFSWQFTRLAVVLDEQLEVSIPHERDVKVKSQTIQPTTREEAGRRIFTWKTSHLESESKTKENRDQAYDAARGLLPPPDVLLSSFHGWDEVGRWYGGLQSDRVQPSPDVTAKAAELTKGLPDNDARLKAIYSYVSLRYRYIGIAFGIGRYQPHSAADILDNQYGDCKDKHTLFAALLSAAGIPAYPALINSSRTIDPDVPSPGQFDHVISVVPQGASLSWMDTTSEVAPFGYLLTPLRDKPALVIMPAKSEFRTTPANSPLANSEQFRISGKLTADGVLDADAQSEFRGDGEYFVRLAFRRVPQAQWQELTQRISYGGGFAGTVSNVDATSPEKTGIPFKMTWHYNRKDFADWGNHRILAALPAFGLPGVQDEDLERKKPLWIGTGDWQYESKIELPTGFTPTLPPPVSLKEDFGEYQGSSDLEKGTVVTQRHLVMKNREIAPSQLKSYKAFQKAISDDEYSYIQLNTGADLASTVPLSPALGGSQLWLKAFTDLPNSTNSEALGAESDARESFRSGEFQNAIAGMKHAVSLDPKFARAWIELGLFYLGMQQKDSALDAFRKAADADPQQVLPYKVLAHAYVEAGDRSRAIAVWQKVQALAPDDRDVAPNLGGLYMAEKRYQEAATLFEAFAKTTPLNAYSQLGLGTAYLRSGERDKGLAALHKALDLDAGAEMLNDVAYEMAEDGTNLTQAVEYSQRSIQEIEEKSRKVDLKNIGPEDLRLPVAISAYWDTLGWIYYKTGDLPKAEAYLSAAWQLRPDGVVGDHLGQVYEKEQKLSAAIHVYSLALEVNPKMEETAARMRKLAHVRLPANRMSAAEELSRMRTVPLPKIVKGTASADFYVLLAPGGRLKGSSFLRGSELLRFADDDLAKAPFKVAFPPGSSAYVLRKGILSCSSYTGCSFVFYPVSDAANPN